MVGGGRKPYTGIPERQLDVLLVKLVFWFLSFLVLFLGFDLGPLLQGHIRTAQLKNCL